ncbi:MAG: altronate dehydratase [Bacteroides sp.]|nr:altronate dehydratase [Bacteroides sp.]
MKRYFRINYADNVAVVLDPEGLKKGETVELDGIPLFKLTEDVPYGHKFALLPVASGEKIIKYGNPIGIAKKDIVRGAWIHSHNLSTGLENDPSYTYSPTPVSVKSENHDDITVNGYLRKNGEMGIRNELWIIPTVGCVNAQANAIAEKLRYQCQLTNVDDVRAFTHNYGCSQLGDDHVNTRTVLADLACHPNAGGVLILGLGCENNQLSALRDVMGNYDHERVRFLVSQDVEDEVEEGVRLCKELLEHMSRDQRQPLPLSKLRVGLKCGGSDGLSGITANPLVGLFSDWLVSQGGTTVLTEVPEMFGAETLLMNRAVNKEIFYKTVALINNFKEYFRSYGQPVYENPSPGNKAGGITTLEEKSLGCVQKAGNAQVADVLQYGERLSHTGLNLLQAPGNDLVASSALGFAGCQLILFTTGRGTPFGTFVPTLKISTNSTLTSHKPKWIDFNAGELINKDTPSEALHRLINKVIATANGETARNEDANAKEIAIFKSGVTL